MSDLSQLGKQPISEAQPCGRDVRDTSGFEALQAEIAKMSNPAANSTPDWPRVAQLAAALLATTGKDVLVASYLAGALLHTHGLAGLADGLGVLADLLQTWWDQLHPPLKRLRARRNAIEWLVDQVRVHGDENDWSALPPQNATLIESLRAAIDAIDGVLRDKDSEAPSLRPLKTLVDTVSVVVEPALSASVNASSIAGDAVSPPTAAALALAPLDSSASAARTIEAALERLGDVATWFAEAEPASAQGFRIRRIAAWAGIEQAPPAQGEQTALPGPIAPIQDALRGLLARRVDQDIVNFAEAQLAQFPFWLDLNAAAAAALARLGDDWAAARREVCNETTKLLDRLPDIARLKFAGGMPFANADTVQWLQTLTASDGNATAVAHDPLQSILTQARAHAADNDLVSAARCVQQALDGHPGAVACVRLRAALCDLLLENRPGARIDPFARALIAEIDRCGVATWDPQLAADGLRAAYAILARNDDNAAETDALLARIAPLDVAIAVRLIT